MKASFNEADNLQSTTGWAFLIGAGIFATTLSQSAVLKLPLYNLLSDELKEPLQATSLFFAIAAIPWYFKVAIGLISDSVPLFGTRRRNFLLMSATLAGALWLFAGYIPRSYFGLLTMFVSMEAWLLVAQ